MRKPRIVVVGSSNTDMIVHLERLPRPGETLLGGRFATSAGGKGANQAIAAARAGGEVTFIARVGVDAMGDLAVSGLQHDGVNTKFVFRDPQAPSGVALIFVGADGENCIAVAGGANLMLSPADIKQAQDAIEHADCLVVQLETPIASVAAAIELAHRKRVPVILNPAPAQQLAPDLLRKIAVLTPNETETEILTGVRVINEESAVLGAKKLRDLGVGSSVITAGERGAYIAVAERFESVAAPFVAAVDTVAAGDVFTGALAVAFAEGESLVDAARFACNAAAISVTRHGAQPSAPHRSEILGLS